VWQRNKKVTKVAERSWGPDKVILRTSFKNSRGKAATWIPGTIEQKRKGEGGETPSSGKEEDTMLLWPPDIWGSEVKPAAGSRHDRNGRLLTYARYTKIKGNSKGVECASTSPVKAKGGRVLQKRMHEAQEKRRLVKAERESERRDCKLHQSWGGGEGSESPFNFDI